MKRKMLARKKKKKKKRRKSPKARKKKISLLWKYIFHFQGKPKSQ
jgi:hypothetical protein